MATRKIITSEDQFLRKKSKMVVKFDEDLAILLDDMKQTLYANNGMGLAAPQIGVLKRCVVMDVNNCYFELVNPQIVKSSGKKVLAEGCLSFPNRSESVERPQKVTVCAFDRLGNQIEITGVEYLARCICHEIDHLNGILFVDYVNNKRGEKN
ncbi:MAG: peptide deformylase [Clostridia bacterium]